VNGLKIYFIILEVRSLIQRSGMVEEKEGLDYYTNFNFSTYG